MCPGVRAEAGSSGIPMHHAGKKVSSGAEREEIQLSSVQK
jgi:hypothetical protein